MRYTALLPLAALFLSVPANAQETPPEPPRGHPPGFFFPQPRFEPGPFVIFFNAGESGISEGASVILDNSVSHWPEAHRPRFVLCYDPAEEGKAGAKLKEERQATVVAELERRGAVQVLNSDWDCYHSAEPLRDSRARMAILGVLGISAPDEQND